MPWWGWALIVVAVVVIVPLKMKVLKKLLSKRNENQEKDVEDF